MYEQPSMPRPPYIKVGAEDAISHRGSVFASSTLREQQNNNRSTAPLHSNAAPPAQTPQGQPLFDRGWQQPLDHPGAQPARRVKDAEGTAQPLVLDTVRWLGYPAAMHIHTAHNQAVTAAPLFVFSLTFYSKPPSYR